MGDPVPLNVNPAFVQIEGSVNGIYNEPAFRYFLARERRRAARANAQLVLVLIVARKPADRKAGLVGCSRKVFAALVACVREVDFVGWYRDQVAAAALLSVGYGPSAIRNTLQARLDRMLLENMSMDERSRLRVRIVVLARNPRT